MTYMHFKRRLTRMKSIRLAVICISRMWASAPAWETMGVSGPDNGTLILEEGLSVSYGADYREISSTLDR